jgi:hypothetical protein
MLFRGYKCDVSDDINKTFPLELKQGFCYVILFVLLQSNELNFLAVTTFAATGYVILIQHFIFVLACHSHGHDGILDHNEGP